MINENIIIKTIIIMMMIKITIKRFFVILIMIKSYD